MVEKVEKLPVTYTKISFKYRVSGGYTGSFKFDDYDLDDSYEWTPFMCFINIPEKYFETWQSVDDFVHSLFGGEGAVIDLEISVVDKTEIEPKWYNHK